MEDPISTPFRGRRILNRGNSVAKHNSKHGTRNGREKHNPKHDTTHTVSKTMEETGLLSPHGDENITGGALRGFIDSRYRGKTEIALLMMVREWRAIAVASSNRREELVTMWREAFVFRRETLVRMALNTWRVQLHKKMQTEDYRYRHTQMKLAEMHDRQRVLRKVFDRLTRHRYLQLQLEFWQKEQGETLAQRSFKILREAAAERRLDRQLLALGEQMAERRQRRTLQQCVAAWREMAVERVAQARHVREQADDEAEVTKRVLRDLLLGWRETANEVAEMEDAADEQYARTLATTVLEKLNTTAARQARNQEAAERYSNYMTMLRTYNALREQFEARRQEREEALLQENEQTQALEKADRFHRTKCLQKVWTVWRHATLARQNEKQQSRVLREWTRRRVQRKRRMLLMAWHATAVKERANELRAEEFQKYRNDALLRRCFARLLKRCSFVPRKLGVADAQTMTSFASEHHACDRGTSAVADSTEFTDMVTTHRENLHDAANTEADFGTDRDAGLYDRCAELRVEDVPGRSTGPESTSDAHSIALLRAMLTQWRAFVGQHAQQEALADAFAIDRHRTSNQKLCLTAIRRWRVRLKQTQQLELAAAAVYKRSVVQRLLVRMTEHTYTMKLKREEADQLQRRYLLTTVWVNLLTVANQRAAERAQLAANARIVDVTDDVGNTDDSKALEIASIEAQDGGALPDKELTTAWEPDTAMVSIADSIDHNIIAMYFGAWRELTNELRATEDAFETRLNHVRRPLLEDCFHKLRKAMHTSAGSVPTDSVPVDLAPVDSELTDAEREGKLYSCELQLRGIVERNAKRLALHRWMVVTRGKLMEDQRLSKTAAAFVRAAAERGRLALTARKMARERLLRKSLNIWRTRIYMRQVQIQNADVLAEGTLAYKYLMHWLSLTRMRRASRLQPNPPRNEDLQLDAPPQSEQRPQSPDHQLAKRTSNSQYERALAFRWEKQMRSAFDALLHASSDERIRVRVAQRSVTREADLMAIADDWNKKRILRKTLHRLSTSTRLHTQQQRLMICLADSWASTNLKRKVFTVLRNRISPNSSMFGSAIGNDSDA
ncbi:hypothetical protein H4R24_001438 [Coemansia sp. RSA 988]|nr:hypothetical protein H4R24_001438 [Coemansia sp. RSA 988]